MAALLNIAWQTLLFRNETERTIELIPLIRLITSAPNEGILRSMAMNMFLFVPYGMFMPYVLHNSCRRIITTVLSAFIFSFVIEVTQYIFVLGRAEVDDILCNTLGATIGSITYWLSNTIEKRTMKKRHD